MENNSAGYCWPDVRSEYDQLASYEYVWRGPGFGLTRFRSMHDLDVGSYLATMRVRCRPMCMYLCGQTLLLADGQSTRAMTALHSALLALHDPKQNPRQVEWLHPSLAKRIAARL